WTLVLSTNYVSLQQMKAFKALNAHNYFKTGWVKRTSYIRGYIMAGREFARGLLEKYGWSEGKGLGKDETGIAHALRPRLKFDTAGVGHKIDLTSQWWSQSFNEAAKSLTVHVSEESVRVEQKKQKKKSPLPKKTYNGFIKAGTQTGNGPLVADEEEENWGEGTEDSAIERAARHGLKMSGKLKRLEEQETQLLCGTNTKKCRPSNKSTDPAEESTVRTMGDNAGEDARDT
ncbi:hypothetical protein HPB47_027936, partial [Ixodes persulcatus]